MVRLAGNAIAGAVAGTVAGAVAGAATVGLVGLFKFTDAGAQELNFKKKKRIEHDELNGGMGMGVGDHKFKNTMTGSLRNS